MPNASTIGMAKISVTRGMMYIRPVFDSVSICSSRDGCEYGPFTSFNELICWISGNWTGNGNLSMRIGSASVTFGRRGFGVVVVVDVVFEVVVVVVIEIVLTDVVDGVKTAEDGIVEEFRTGANVSWRASTTGLVISTEVSARVLDAVDILTVPSVNVLPDVFELAVVATLVTALSRVEGGRE